MVNGSFYLRTGGGHDIHFVRSGKNETRSETVSDLYQRIALSEDATLRALANTVPNVTVALEKVSAPGGPIDINTGKIDVLTGPGGVVTRHSQRIADAEELVLSGIDTHCSLRPLV